MNLVCTYIPNSKVPSVHDMTWLTHTTTPEWCATHLETYVGSGLASMAKAVRTLSVGTTTNGVIYLCLGSSTTTWRNAGGLTCPPTPHPGRSAVLYSTWRQDTARRHRETLRQLTPSGG